MSQPHDPKRRAWWLKKMHEWHWISSAICLVGILLFSITGITLNHAGSIEAKPVVDTQTRTLPADMLARLAEPDGADKALPLALRDWIERELGVEVGHGAVEWSDEEVYVSLPRAGGDAWLSIDRGSGELEYEATDRGWIALFNDLHKGRHTGAVWAAFIDIFAVACVVFSLTGFFLLQLHARRRPMTWPLVGSGALVLILIAAFFIH